MWVEDFREKTDATSQRVSVDELMAGERNRLKRMRQSEPLDHMQSSSAASSFSPQFYPREPSFHSESKRVRPKAQKQMALAMQQRQFFSTYKPVIPTPNFEVGEEITFSDYEAHISGGGIVTKVVLPGEPGNEYPAPSPFIVPINERPVSNHEILYEIDTIANNIKRKR